MPSEHTRFRHNDCEDARCPYCEGGLFCCVVCGGAEASLPSECPGRRMTESEQEDVMAGRLDYSSTVGWYTKEKKPHA